MGMDMLNFNAHSGREIQSFIALITQCEAEGVTDVRFIRERLQNHIRTTRRRTRKPVRQVAKKSQILCQCGGNTRVLPVNNTPATQTGNPDEIAVILCVKCSSTEYVTELPENVKVERI